MKKRKLVLICVLCILLSMVVFGCIYTFVLKDKNNISDAPSNIFDFSMDDKASSGDIDSKSVEEIQEELNKKVEDGMINISMNTSPVFENGTSEGNLSIINKEINKYPQVVEIYLDDTKELIYKSGGIPVGSNIEKDKLDVSLSKGTYKCTAYFNAINEETKELVGTAGAKIEITVRN